MPIGSDDGGDYTIIQDYIYQDSLLRIDRITGEQPKILPMDRTKRIDELYTDGKNLYGICVGHNESTGTMIRIVYEEVESENPPIIILEKKNGIKIEQDKFYYKTMPMGETK